MFNVLMFHTICGLIVTEVGSKLWVVKLATQSYVPLNAEMLNVWVSIELYVLQLKLRRSATTHANITSSWDELCRISTIHDSVYSEVF